jgi:hypothetical protein
MGKSKWIFFYTQIVDERPECLDLREFWPIRLIKVRGPVLQEALFASGLQVRKKISRMWIVLSGALLFSRTKFPFL